MKQSPIENYRGFFNTRSEVENPRASKAGHALRKIVDLLNKDYGEDLTFSINDEDFSDMKALIECRKNDTGTRVKVIADFDLDTLADKDMQGRSDIILKLKAATGFHQECTGPISPEDDVLQHWASSIMTIATCQLAEEEKTLTRHAVFKQSALNGPIFPE